MNLNEIESFLITILVSFLLPLLLLKFLFYLSDISLLISPTSSKSLPPLSSSPEFFYYLLLPPSYSLSTPFRDPKPHFPVPVSTSQTHPKSHIHGKTPLPSFRFTILPRPTHRKPPVAHLFPKASHQTPIHPSHPDPRLPVDHPTSSSTAFSKPSSDPAIPNPSGHFNAAHHSPTVRASSPADAPLSPISRLSCRFRPDPGCCTVFDSPSTFLKTPNGRPLLSSPAAQPRHPPVPLQTSSPSATSRTLLPAPSPTPLPQQQLPVPC